MRLDINPARPLIMHIDLNSCFATVEQQARPLLRGRPVAIVNRRTEHTMTVTASYEAKAMGVKLGMRLRDAKKLCPDLVGLESDPPKYRYVYQYDGCGFGIDVFTGRHEGLILAEGGNFKRCVKASRAAYPLG